jgi:hypothetical protein
MMYAIGDDTLTGTLMRCFYWSPVIALLRFETMVPPVCGGVDDRAVRAEYAPIRYHHRHCS